MLALLSVWIALGALATSIFVVTWRKDDPELVLTLLPYTVALSATFAAGVLWALRNSPRDDPGIMGRRNQAISAIVMNSLTFAVLLIFLHGIAYGLLGLLLEGAFLCFVYWLYTRILVPISRKSSSDT